MAGQRKRFPVLLPQVLIRVDQKVKLAQFSEDQNMTVSEIVRMALDEYFARRTPAKDEVGTILVEG